MSRITIQLPSRPSNDIDERLGRPKPESGQSGWVAGTVLSNNCTNVGFGVFQNHPLKLQNGLFDVGRGYLVPLPTKYKELFENIPQEAFPAEVIVVWEV